MHTADKIIQTHFYIMIKLVSCVLKALEMISSKKILIQ